MSAPTQSRQKRCLTGVYIHLPYCDVKCAYCDFFSIAQRHIDDTTWRRYVDRLKSDLAHQLSLLGTDTPQPVLASVFFGGGTPSKAPAFLVAQTIEAILKSFPQKVSNIEITAEANPESLKPQVLAAWRAAGVNRVSVGMQSLDEATLRYLGRLYRPLAYAQVLSRVRAAGFVNYSADFITGVPGQSVQSTLRDLEFAIREGVTHVSLYQLTVEPGTLLEHRIRRGEVPPTADAEQVLQMDAAIEFLAAQGFQRYEISNFARPGFRSVHNRIYWTYRPYLGLGVAAHAFTGRRRFFHARSLNQYLVADVQTAEDCGATSRDALIGYLRLMQPFTFWRIARHFAPEHHGAVSAILEQAVAAGWLARQGMLFSLTHRGAKYSDSLLARLWNI